MVSQTLNLSQLSVPGLVDPDWLALKTQAGCHPALRV
jgi:hypothetical protein